jgi:hypothetical protein
LDHNLLQLYEPLDRLSDPLPIEYQLKLRGVRKII